MSYSTIEWVFNQPLPVQDKLILTFIAKCENEQEPCFASVKLIAAKCGVSPRTVQRILKKHRETGLISSNPRFRTDGSQTSNFNFINVDKNVTAVSPPYDTHLTGGDDNQLSPADAKQESGLELLNKTKLKQNVRSDTLNGSCLVYPKGLTKHSRDSIGRILEGIPNDAAQMLLDELSGAMAKNSIEKRNRPEYWLSAVAMRYRAGHFKPKLGLDIAKCRNKQTQTHEPPKALSNSPQHAEHHMREIKALLGKRSTVDSSEKASRAPIPQKKERQS